MRVYIQLIIFSLCCLSVKVVFAQDSKPDQSKLVNFYQAQQYEEAAVYLQSFYQEGLRDQKLLEGLAYCYRMAGNYTQAERYY